MKHINVVFTEDELDELRDIKGDRTWREAIREEFGVDD